MKKILTLIFGIFCFSSISNAGLFDLWADEDEEVQAKYSAKSTNRTNLKVDGYAKSSPVYDGSSEESTKFVNNKYKNTDERAFPRRAVVDYDTYQSERVIHQDEFVSSIDKWKDGNINTFWENYRGNNIRIEVRRSNRDVKEMRLKFVQSVDMASDPDDSISNILNVVADNVMKRMCGRQVKQRILLYEKPSVELERETVGDPYKVMTRGTSLKEYGFRCLY